MHIDMDAFFASIEQLDNPAYRGKPVIVGADPKGRGVVSTCSYEARKFGVHSAMPIGEALRKCPQGIFLPVRGKRYAQVSQQIMAIFSSYTPLIEPLSIDEAFLDLTGSERIFGPVQTIARTIVRRIETEVGLGASVGLAPNKFLAKLGSDLKKPKGFVVFTPENVLDILEDLPVGKLWGVGARTEELLKKMGIQTIGMLRRYDPEILRSRLGEAGIQLYQLAQGRDERPVIPDGEAKSIGREITFSTDTGDREFLSGVLLSLADQVARQLRRNHLKGSIITIKIRDTNFKTITRQTTLTEATDFEEMIYQVALKLAKAVEWGVKNVRLVGISISGFDKEKVQLSLFELDDSASALELQTLHQTIDQLKNKYGETIVTKGTILNINQQWQGKKNKE